MDASEEQNTGAANGTSQTSGRVAHMSLYERQAVQVGVVLQLLLQYLLCHLLPAF